MLVGSPKKQPEDAASTPSLSGWNHHTIGKDNDSSMPSPLFRRIGFLIWSAIKLFGGSNVRPAAATGAPVIGILAQPKHNSTNQYIAASYVKWLEAGGARSIPIPYDADDQLVDELFEQMNGLLLPGGASELPRGVIHLLDRVVESNNEGLFFPVWGTCLGFEFLVHYIGGEGALQQGFEATNMSLALNSVKSHVLYRDPFTFETVVTRNVTMNNHEQGIEPTRFLENDLLTSVWDITSTNVDMTGRPFVSTIEPVDPGQFPLYGVQYHPEKNAFEYATYPGTDIPYEAIDHSGVGVMFSIALAQFFVHQVRRGQHENANHSYTKPSAFPTINTYPVISGIKYEQEYIVPPASHWNTYISLA